MRNPTYQDHEENSRVFKSLMEDYYQALLDGSYQNKGLVPIVRELQRIWVVIPYKSRARLVDYLENRCKQFEEERANEREQGTGGDEGAGEAGLQATARVLPAPAGRISRLQGATHRNGQGSGKVAT